MAKVTTSIDWPVVRKRRHLKRKMKPPKISKAVKYGLTFFNGAFWALSLLLIGSGYYSITSSDTAAVKTSNVFAMLLNISVLLLLIGLVMFAISLAGILGTLRESLPLLRFYRGCIVAFLFFEFGLSIFCFGFPSFVAKALDRDLPHRTLAAYHEDANMQNLLDFMQHQFSCCGVSMQGFQDWSVNVYFNCSEANPSVDRCGVPWSCCVHPDRGAIRDFTCGRGVQLLSAVEANDRIHTEGCISAVANWIMEHAHVVGASCIAVAFAQGAVMYQTTRICILLERMAPKRDTQGAGLLGAARLAMLVGLLTGRSSPQDPEPGQPAAGSRRSGKRKRREEEDDEEKRKKKRREKEKREENDEEDSSSESDD